MKRRWLYRPGEPPVELAADWSPTPRTELMTGTHYEGVRATDGTDLSSRRKHSEYMRRNGLALASDFKNTWEQAAKERASNFDQKARREAVARAVYQRFKP